MSTLVILAAGIGVRLRPHTLATPKPLLTHNGRPVISHIIAAAQLAGFDRYCVVLNYLGEDIARYLNAEHTLQDDVHYVWQSDLSGTSAALRAAFAHPVARLSDRDALVVTAADYAYPSGYLSRFLERATESESGVAVAFRHLRGSRARQSALLELDSDYNVKYITEKPRFVKSGSNPCAVLLYAFRRSAVTAIHDVLQAPTCPADLPSAVGFMIRDEHSVTAIPMPDLPDWEAQYRET